MDAVNFQRRIVRVHVAGLDAPYVLDVVRAPSSLLTCYVTAPTGCKVYTATPTGYHETPLVSGIVADILRETGTYRVVVEADGDPAAVPARALAQRVLDAAGGANPTGFAAVEAAFPGTEMAARTFAFESTPLALRLPETHPAPPSASGDNAVTFTRSEVAAVLAALDGAAMLAGLIPGWNTYAPHFRALAGLGDTLAAVDTRVPLALVRVRAGVDTLRARLDHQGVDGGAVPAPAPPAALAPAAPTPPLAPASSAPSTAAPQAAAPGSAPAAAQKHHHAHHKGKGRA
jgi:hypothetical protein